MTARGRAIAVAVALLAGCAEPRPAPTRARSAPAASSESTAHAFDRLNAIQRQARRAPGALAAYTVYHDAWTASDGVLRDFLAQVLAASFAELGLYEQAVQGYPGRAPKTRGEPAPFPDADAYVAVDAAAAIAELARDRRIVLVNEVHHAAQTRLLTFELLAPLRALGYTHFAAESIDETDAALNRRGYPTNASGPYVGEPLYGELVREALRLGYVVTPYESRRDGGDPATRETDQAQNLYRRVFENRPDARVLVHAGYAHVHEREGYLPGTRPMAMQLAQLVGSDPLTIDQTLLRGIAPGREHAMFDALLSVYTPRRPVVLRARDGTHVWSLEPGIYDISVLLPRSRPVAGRPDWLLQNGRRTTWPIDPADCRGVVPCLLEARRVDESDEAVPVDRVLRDADGEARALMLPPGRYRLRASNVRGGVLHEREIDVHGSNDVSGERALHGALRNHAG